MTITINNKEYTITNDAHIEYRSGNGVTGYFSDPYRWAAMEIADESDIDEFGNPHQYIAWYYCPEMDDEGFELDQIDYDEPDDLQDIGY